MHSQKLSQDLACVKIKNATNGGQMTKSVFFSLKCYRKFCVILEEDPPEGFFMEKIKLQQLKIESQQRMKMKLTLLFFVLEMQVRTSSSSGTRA